MLEQLCAPRKPHHISRERRQEPPLAVNHRLQLGQFSLSEATSTLTLHHQLWTLVLFMPVQSQAPDMRSVSSPSFGTGNWVEQKVRTSPGTTMVGKR